jgi:hypothetical protein
LENITEKIKDKTLYLIYYPIRDIGEGRTMGGLTALKIAQERVTYPAFDNKKNCEIFMKQRNLEGNIIELKQIGTSGFPVLTEDKKLNLVVLDYDALIALSKKIMIQYKKI